MTSASAVPIAADLSYSCPFPLVGNQPIEVHIETDIPDTIAVGEQTPPIDVTGTAAVGPAAHNGLGLVQSATLTGSATSAITVDVPGIRLPIQLPIALEDTPIPPAPYNGFEIPFAGSAPALTFAEAGTGVITVDDLRMEITPLTASGEPTGLGTFTPDCTPVPNEPVQIHEFEITDGGGGDPAGEDPAGEDPAGEDPAGEDPAGEDPAGEDPAGEDPAGEDPAGEDPAGEDPAGEDPAGEDPAGEDPAGEDPAGEDPAGEDPAGEDPAGEDPAGEDPAGEDPGGPGGGVIDYGFNLTGTSHIGAANGDVPLTGSLDAQFNLADNSYEADLRLDPTSGRMNILGFLPVTASVEFGQAGPTTGTLIGGVLEATAPVDIYLPSFRVFGVLPIGGGEDCRSSETSQIELTSTGEFFNPLDGGEMAGTYEIAPLVDCGFLNPIISIFAQGSNNTLTINLDPTS
ncbi:hypothetical protein RM780_13420 [Streptomyces sp. DSM 44917]|uniref:DUF6801 domain-containing protein n=1 Tax=Streptomyces boetiae TaxID=3075541 RepID=A0ABU2L9E8_9ACTN|nr:DUF6801 domain-containing protein [Streptomyces sp. DSM 44917]MDT0307957.1 hypothetical protein [Streptomyces sp. DSM 44917]